MTPEQELEKLKRRQQRNQRHAHASGLLQGIVSMLREGDVVFDCGANIGVVTEPLASTGATVHAFEPDPWAFRQLSRKFSGNNNVVLHNAAVGTSEGSIRLMRAANFDDNPKGASVKSTVIERGRNINTEAADSIEVKMIDLPAMLENQFLLSGEIAFVKMDIEGAELDLLQKMHAQGLFDKIGLTVAETHESKFKQLRPEFRELRETIAGAYPTTRVNLDWI